MLGTEEERQRHHRHRIDAATMLLEQYAKHSGCGVFSNNNGLVASWLLSEDIYMVRMPSPEASRPALAYSANGRGLVPNRCHVER